MGVRDALTVSAPASTAAAAQAAAIFIPSLSSTPRWTFCRAGACSRRERMNRAHSPGVMIPAESHTVTASAPASAAAAISWQRNAGSARVASMAEKATCSV